MEQNRREHTRIYQTYRIAYVIGDSSIPSLVMNISSKGVAFITKKKLTIGDSVSFLFSSDHIPDGVNLEARIIRIWKEVAIDYAAAEFVNVEMDTEKLVKYGLSSQGNEDSVRQI